MLQSTTSIGSRFRAQFGAAGAALFAPSNRAFVVLSVCAGVAAATVFSAHLAVAILILGISVIFAGCDRRHLDALLVPPSLVGGYMAVSGGAIGAAFLAADADFSFGMPLFMLQAFFAYSLVCSGLVTIACLRDTPGIFVPAGDARFRRDCLRPLALFAWLMLSSQAAFFVAGLTTGRLDRGQFGAEAFGTFVGVTLADVVPRFMEAGFLFAPAAWLVHRRPARAALGCALMVLLFLGLTTGSRGLVARPILSLLLGCYLFVPLRPRLLAIAASASALSLLLLLPVMLRFRDSPEFFDTPAWDIQARAQTLLESTSQSAARPDEGLQSRALTVGTHLLGVGDLLVYENTPVPIPFAGASGLDQSLTAWIPQYFMPNRPTLMDGNEIVTEYRGEYVSRTSATITLEADLYRRWGFLGVLLGVPASAFISGMFIRAALRTLLFRDAVFGYLLLSVVMSMFFWSPWSTVSWSLQRWTYDIPKHVVFALVIAAIARRLVGACSRGGLVCFERYAAK